jgi:glycosyltransferase involved in cell wall biosynthesis
LANKIKLKNINHIVCNSKFTKKFIDKEYGVDSKVIYPPVDVDSFKTRGKENIILTVGRFSKLLQAKRQDILIEAFKKMVDNGLKGWKFQLAGSTDVGGWEYLAALKSLAGDYPIEFYENCSFDILKNLYSKAKIFWYAGGYGIDEEKEPEKVEHFGITVVEAMAAGCIPFVCPKGGLKETVKDKKTGFYYQNLAQLQSFTQKLILDSQKTENMAKEVVKSSYQFGKNAFCEKFKEILK